MDTPTIPASAASQPIEGITPQRIDKIKYRLNDSIQAYRNESLRVISERIPVEPMAGDAIIRWLSSGNVRVEFYSSEHHGEIRVRILANDSKEITQEMSLRSFINSAPVVL